MQHSCSLCALRRACADAHGLKRRLYMRDADDQRIAPLDAAVYALRIHHGNVQAVFLVR